MAVEFSACGLGSELRLRALLIETVVDLLRWEASLGNSLPPGPAQMRWPAMERALHYIHEHYTQPLYVSQIAHEIGATTPHLQAMFQQALGMSCIQYLRSYRISHAAALLQAPDARVTDVALAVGFESFGHFNSSFRSFFGLSPAQYRKRCRRK
jgi:transcriptional regulator GlxA family with amidase domain